jgi:DNA polymerase-4
VPLRELILDFNSYFASVEQQDRPDLRARPVAVAPVMTDHTCCIAASYEAKRWGIKTGTMVGAARKICPALVVVEARPPLYVEYHHRLVAAVDSVLPVSEVLSIDEMRCALRGRWQERETVLGLARQIKRTIASTVGIYVRCSIGIAPNGFLAKTASDMEKPDGLVVIDESDLPEILFRLELTDLCGIAEAREGRLHACGIRTVEQLCRAPKALLRAAWHGIEGERMYALLRGEVVERAPTQRCTVGHSHVLEPQFRTLPLAEAVLQRLLQKAATRLRSLGYMAGGLGVALKFIGRPPWGDEVRFVETQDTLDFIRAFALVWRRRPESLPPPLWVGVTLFHLTAARNVTPSFPQLIAPRAALDKAMDRLNARYGRNSVYFGGAQAALDAAPTRIAFTHIPKVEKEREEITPRPRGRKARADRSWSRRS